MPQLVRIGTLMGAARGGAGAWTPADLGASLLARWSADRADLITLSGAQVTSWKDTVAAFNLTQAVSGSRPLYSATSFNGAPGVTFDGADDLLLASSSPWPSAALGSEIWALVDQTALAADASVRIIFGYGGGNGAVARLLFRNVISGQNNPIAQTGTGGGATSSALAADFSGRHVLRGIFTPTTVGVAMDGVSSTPVAAVSSTGTTNTNMGSSTSSTGPFKGVIRDVLVASPLTSDQTAMLETYLYNRRMP